VSWEVEVVLWRGKMMVMMIAKCKPVLSFTKALNAFETTRMFMYAHITKIGQADIIRIEILLFNLKMKGATEHLKVSDFLKKR
jgi:hypothetical protein